MESAGADAVEQVALAGPEGPVRVAVAVHVSARARRIGLSVRRDGSVRLTVPSAAQRKAALAFLEKQHAWLLRVLARRATAPMRTAEPLAVYLARVPWVSADGRQWALECAETAVRPFFVFMEGDEPVILRHRGGAAAEGDLLALLRGVAGVALPRRVAVLGARVSVPFKRVCVRDQQGRWGSCSGTGSVSLNWRLVLLPPELQDYVILHELAHRREMNHSARFWKLLSGWDAACEANDRALSKQWGHLMDLGRGGASLE